MKISGFHRVFDERMITWATIDPGHVLVEEAVCSAVFEEIQQMIRSRAGEITQIELRNEFIHITQGPIKRTFDNGPFICTFLDAFYALATVKVPSVLFDSYCMVLIFRS